MEPVDPSSGRSPTTTPSAGPPTLYDRQRPEPFAAALTAAKSALDPRHPEPRRAHRCPDPRRGTATTSSAHHYHRSHAPRPHQTDGDATGCSSIWPGSRQAPGSPQGTCQGLRRLGGQRPDAHREPGVGPAPRLHPRTWRRVPARPTGRRDHRRGGGRRPGRIARARPVLDRRAPLRGPPALLRHAPHLERRARRPHLANLSQLTLAAAAERERVNATNAKSERGRVDELRRPAVRPSPT